MSSITTAQKLIKGVMKYKNTIGKDLATVFEDVKSNPNVRFLFQIKILIYFETYISNLS